MPPTPEPTSLTTPVILSEAEGPASPKPLGAARYITPPRRKTVILSEVEEPALSPSKGPASPPRTVILSEVEGPASPRHNPVIATHPKSHPKTVILSEVEGPASSHHNPGIHLKSHPRTAILSLSKGPASPQATQPHPNPTHPANRTLTLIALLLLLPSLQAQSPPQTTPSDPRQQLQQLIDTEQAALGSGDPNSILSSGRQLAALALRVLGGLYTSEQQWARAGDSLRQSLALEDDPGPDTRLALITADLHAGHPDLASLTAQQILQNSGDTALSHIQIANAHHTAGDLPGTLAELNRAVAVDPASASAHLALGIAFWELNEYQYNADSLREFTAAQRLDPGSYLNNLNLGSVLSQYERFTEAQPFLERAAAADPAAPEPWLQIGMNAYAQNQFTEAQPALLKAVTLTAQDPAGQSRNSFQIRRVYAVLSRIEAAENHDADGRKFADLADQVHAAMLQSEASKPLSQSIGLVVNNPPQGIDPPAPSNAPNPQPNSTSNSNAPAPASPAQKEIEQKLLSVVANSLNDAGTALARTHDYAGALPLFREAALADPTLPPVHRNLGLAAFHTGAYDEAISAFTEALRENPADQLSANYLKQSRNLRTSPAPAVAPAPHP